MSYQQSNNWTRPWLRYSVTQVKGRKIDPQGYYNILPEGINRFSENQIWWQDNCFDVTLNNSMRQRRQKIFFELLVWGEEIPTREEMVIFWERSCVLISEKVESQTLVQCKKNLRFPSLDQLFSSVYFLSLGTIAQSHIIHGIIGIFRSFSWVAFSANGWVFKFQVLSSRSWQLIWGESRQYLIDGRKECTCSSSAWYNYMRTGPWPTPLSG